MYYILFLFFAYSFLGWVLESFFALVYKRKTEKRGFLIGPICPIYGYGGVFFHFLSFLLPHPFFFFLLAACFATAAERVSGAFFRRKAGRRYWDYSNAPLHLGSDISLFFSLIWGILALVAVKTVEPFLRGLYENAVQVPLFVFLTVCFFLYLADTVLSCIYALRLQNRTSLR